MKEKENVFGVASVSPTALHLPASRSLAVLAWPAAGPRISTWPAAFQTPPGQGEEDGRQCTFPKCLHATKLTGECPGCPELKATPPLACIPTDLITPQLVPNSEEGISGRCVQVHWLYRCCNRREKTKLDVDDPTSTLSLLASYRHLKAKVVRSQSSRVRMQCKQARCAHAEPHHSLRTCPQLIKPHLTKKHFFQFTISHAVQNHVSSVSYSSNVSCSLAVCIWGQR